MIAHRDFRELAARAIDGPLAEDERLELGRHRFGCSACQRYEAGLLADDRALAVMPPLAPPAAVDRHIEAVLADRGASRRLSPIFVLLVTALVMGAAVGSALAVGAFLQRLDDGRLPQRPDTPAGWTLAISSALDVRVALPPYVVTSAREGGVTANEPPAGNSLWLGVMAVGPRDATQPLPGQTLEHWLLAGAGAVPRSDVEVRRVALPAGLAVEVRAIFMPGTPEASHLLAYAVETRDGFAWLRITGRPEDFANHAADIALIPYLLEAGPMLTAAVAAADTVRLEFDLPEGWSYQAAVAGSGRKSDIGLITNRELVASQGEVIVWIEHYPGGEPRYRPDSATLPEGVVRDTVAGQPAIRWTEGTRVTWEVESPGEATGLWILTATYDLGSPQGMIDLVQVIVEDARFVQRR